jgi:mono/diheme cytochrome c family protein
VPGNRIDGMIRKLILIAILLTPLSGGVATAAPDALNGQVLSERRCVSCHRVTHERPRSLESIANTPNVSVDTIVEFLLLPHAVMPNLALCRSDAQDIATYIAQMKK